jgi:hypothetical protein
MAEVIPEGFVLKEQIASLANMILEKHPQMPGLLREIHTALTKQPENILLLSEEDMNKIVQGLEVQTNSYLATAIAKTEPKSLAGKLKKGANLQDLLGLD